MESLAFEQLDARQTTIKTAHAETCQWLLETDDYLEWNDSSKLKEHHGLLWIKGKAGTGKSTLMKFAVLEARRTMKDSIVLSFFFNSRGEEIEQSIIGTYRSLLLQLFKRLPELQDVFNALALSAPKISAQYKWTLASLEVLLEQAVQRLGDSLVVCFIDALDECDEDQVRDMVRFLERIGRLAMSKSASFRVCFSSRHYPHITVRNGLQLVLEGHEGHTQDITSYIKTELMIGHGSIAQQVRVELQEKASGIFMWVVLVVGILNKESDRGQVHRLRRKLQEIPSDLNELFREILTRDTHNRAELILCIQWILFSTTPLSPEQLYDAVLLGIDPEAVTGRDPEEVISPDVIRRFILDSSKGLAEATVSDDPKVQFIHESVRDLLLKENGLGKIWPEYKLSFLGRSHEQLKRCCFSYVSWGATVLLTKPKPDKRSRPYWEATPFLEYAICTVLEHADTAAGGGISQAGFLHSFPLRKWIQLRNIYGYSSDPRKEDISFLYLLSMLDLANLVRSLDSVSRCMDMESERYGCPLFAAAALGNENTLEIFLDHYRADDGPIAPVCEQKPLYESAEHMRRRDFEFSEAENLLLNAARLGHDGVFALLIRSERFDINSKDTNYRTVLWWACRNACEMSGRLLLTAGSAGINSKDRNNETPLYVAVQQDHRVLIRMLLEHGADVNAKTGFYGNALQAAIMRGHNENVLLLINNGADIHAQCGYYGTALQAASRHGLKGIVELLLRQGANVNAAGGNFGNALQAACRYDEKEIVEMLLRNGANVNAQGGLYGSALQVAAYAGHKELVKLLLEHGADVNAKGGLHKNALRAALNNCSHSNSEVVALLEEAGASRTST